MKLEDLTRGASIKGILPDQLVTVVDISWHSSFTKERSIVDCILRKIWSFDTILS